MNPSEPLPADLLLDHAESVRALARGLLGEEHSAEDVVQETWVRALERPPRRRDGLRGWLASVARSTALNRLRSEERRVRRERVASREESLAPADEVVERGQVLRAVVDAVMQLDEPYRSVVLLRYYEDRPPREIAALRGVRLATVKSQLHRALELLRGRLDADVEGGRRHWASALAVVTGGSRALPYDPEPSSGPRGSGAGKGSEMIVKWALGLGLSLVGGVGVAHWVAAEPGAASGARRGAPRAQGVEERLAAGGAEGASGIAPVDAPGRTPLPAAAAPRPVAAADVPDELGFRVRGVVVDDLDRPLADATVYLAPPAHPLDRVASTDAAGAFDVHVAGAGAAADLVLWVQHGSLVSALTRLHVSRGEPGEVRVGLQPAFPVAGTRAGVRFEDVSLSAVSGLGDTDDGRVMAYRIRTKGVFASVIGDAPALVPVEDGPAPFRWYAERPFVVQLMEADAQGHRSYLEAELVEVKRGMALLAVGENVELRAAPEDGPGTLRRISGQVLDASGTPVPGAPLLLVEAGRASALVADEAGRFELDVTAGEAALLAGGGELGRASVSLPVSGDLVWSARLDRGLEVRGSLVDPEGAPLAGWRVEYVPDGAGAVAADTARTDADGSFALPNQPAGSGRLFVCAPGAPAGLPARVLDAVVPGGGELLLDLDPVPAGRLGVTLAGADGAPVEGADVRVWQAETGRGAWMAAAGDGAYAAEVPAGAYRVVAGSPRTGWVDLGEHWVGAGEGTDLGEAVLPAPGRLQGRVAGSGWTLEGRVGELETRFASGAAGESVDVELPPGEYTLVLEGAEREPLPLRVLPGAVLDLGALPDSAR